MLLSSQVVDAEDDATIGVEAAQADSPACFCLVIAAEDDAMMGVEAAQAEGADQQRPEASCDGKPAAEVSRGAGGKIEGLAPKRHMGGGVSISISAAPRADTRAAKRPGNPAGKRTGGRP